MIDNATKYKSGSGKEVIIEKLDNIELIKLYKFFMEYVRKIKKIIAISKNIEIDKNYIKFYEDMVSIKEGIKNEIKKRKS